ncbi:MAG: MGMT family protein [Archangium sp.]|nr:MGMT family protein [Archangium sp.]MDP3156861.1 MGMT family protein [Archangium sp.]MDP3575538.1 MGMT family protein [Archangium sp.]
MGSDGSLTGYGGGLPRKHWLLAHEGRGRQPARFALKPGDGDLRRPHPDPGIS